jgi:hypothetical protein
LWNVQGLSTKLCDSEFLTLISAYDIVILTETWCSRNSNVKINGFNEYACPRPTNSKRAKRDSGGIVVYCSIKYADGFSVEKVDNKGALGFKLDKNYFGIENDAYYCICYIPPYRSTLYSNVLKDIDFYEHIGDDMRHYSDIGDVYLCGDLNSRVAERLDFVENVGLDRFVDIPDITSESVPERKSDDKVVNSFGLQLLEFCKQHNMYIANGRLEPGRFTFYGAKGSSVVDYLITNDTCFSNIVYMSVLDLSDMSDHCPVEFKTRIKLTTHTPANTSDRIVWSDDQTPQLDNLRAHLVENINKLEVTVNGIVDGSVSIDKGVVDITEFLHDSSFKFFGKSNNRQHAKRPAGNRVSEWFDDSCRVAKAEFLTAKRRFKECPTNVNRDLFLSKRGIFAKRKRVAKATFANSEKRKMKHLSATNPKKFWKHINKYKMSANKVSSNVSLHDFVTHFEHISNTPHPHDTNNVEYDEELSHSQTNESLDQAITSEEILKCIHSLKRNKSPGLDGIPGEFFIDCSDLILPYLVQVFNYIFDSGVYPEIWSKGVIVPIPKKGDKSTPGNYRGITLINVFAKIFSLVLRNRLNTWCESESVFNSYQFGFRDRRSTVDCVFLLKGIIDKVLCERVLALLKDSSIC